MTYGLRRPRRTLPEGVTLVENERSKTETFRRRKKETLLKDYDVSLDGVKLGRVYQSVVSVERKTPGRTYVNSRWSALRWKYEDDHVGSRDFWDRPYNSEYTTQIDAVLSLIEKVERKRVDAEATTSEETG